MNIQKKMIRQRAEERDRVKHDLKREANRHEHD